MGSTITIPVPAESPPMKAKRVRASSCCDIGRVSTKVSASTPPPANRMSPASAMGRTKTLMSRRYRGKSQSAFARWSSSTFSTTEIWNCRGRNMMDSIERTVRNAQVP